MDNGQALVEGEENYKNKKSIQDKGQKMLQIGNKMEEDGEENDGHISQLGSGYLVWWKYLQTGLQALAIYQMLRS